VASSTLRWIKSYWKIPRRLHLSAVPRRRMVRWTDRQFYPTIRQRKIDTGYSLPSCLVDSHQTRNLSSLYCLPHHEYTQSRQWIWCIDEGRGVRLSSGSVQTAYPVASWRSCGSVAFSRLLYAINRVANACTVMHHSDYVRFFNHLSP
jgi:hypothetical protein